MQDFAYKISKIFRELYPRTPLSKETGEKAKGPEGGIRMNGRKGMGGKMKGRRREGG